MGQLTLADLDGLGAAAVKAVKWLSEEFTEEIGLALESFIQDMNAANGSFIRANAVIPPGMHAAEGSHTLERLDWSQRLWAAGEWEERYRRPTWCLLVGCDEQESIDVHLRMYFLDGEPFTVSLQSDRRDRSGEMTPMPELLKWARGRDDQFPDSRRTAQGLDALSR